MAALLARALGREHKGKPALVQRPVLVQCRVARWITRRDDIQELGAPSTGVVAEKLRRARRRRNHAGTIGPLPRNICAHPHATHATNNVEHFDRRIVPRTNAS